MDIWHLLGEFVHKYGHEKLLPFKCVAQLDIASPELKKNLTGLDPEATISFSGEILSRLTEELYNLHRTEMCINS